MNNGINKGVRIRKSSLLTLIEIEKDKASFKGYSWRALGNFGKRKMENLLYLKNIGGGADVKFNYI